MGSVGMEAQKAEKIQHSEFFVCKICYFFTSFDPYIFRPHVQGGSHSLICNILLDSPFSHILARFGLRNVKKFVKFEINLPLYY